MENLIAALISFYNVCYLSCINDHTSAACYIGRALHVFYFACCSAPNLCNSGCQFPLSPPMLSEGTQSTMHTAPETTEDAALSADTTTTSTTTTTTTQRPSHNPTSLLMSKPESKEAAAPAPAMDRMRSNLSAVDVRTSSYMLLNFASSTALVVLNKMAMDKFGFRFATSLTAFHLTCTFILLLMTAKLGLFEIKRLPIRDVAKLAVGNMGFICLTNLSLQHNSVGFYQVMKVMTTPTIVLIEALLYQTYLENDLKISLIPVCLGVIFTVATDFRLNLIGTGYAVAGVVVTSFYQIWAGTLQKSLDCNGLQLQTYVSPLAAVFTLPFVPLFDNYTLESLDSIWFYNFSSSNMSIIAVTGLFAFLVNISIFLVIGRSSPLSYNILGHLKTIVVLMSDYLFFGRPYTFKSSFGILLTMVGIFWYTNIKLERARIDREARERTPPPKLDDSHPAEEDEDKELVTSREE